MREKLTEAERDFVIAMIDGIDGPNRWGIIRWLVRTCRDPSLLLGGTPIAPADRGSLTQA